MTEEISTKDGVSDICDKKIPSKGLPESQVEGAGCCTEGHNAGIVDRLGWRTCREGGTGQLGKWYKTDFSSNVHQEAQTTCPVGNKEQVTQ